MSQGTPTGGGPGTRSRERVQGVPGAANVRFNHRFESARSSITSPAVGGLSGLLVRHGQLRLQPRIDPPQATARPGAARLSILRDRPGLTPPRSSSSSVRLGECDLPGEPNPRRGRVPKEFGQPETHQVPRGTCGRPAMCSRTVQCGVVGSVRASGRSRSDRTLRRPRSATWLRRPAPLPR